MRLLLLLQRFRGDGVSNLFPNHSYSSEILTHIELPVYQTYEFDFYRCVEFLDSFYGKTTSELHKGNLRINKGGRHSKLFPEEQLSYWADSPVTAHKEVKHHGSSNNLLMFWAYDDASSTFPTISPREPLIIIDGRNIGFADILKKVETNVPLTADEDAIIERIRNERPDCLAYNSHVKDSSVNFLFFEKGFRKLALREVYLRLGDRPAKNSNCIVCAGTSDYSPNIEAYGEFFEPIAKIRKNAKYKQSEEYLSRKAIYEEALRAISGR